jgi:hypothetical protein
MARSIARTSAALGLCGLAILGIASCGSEISVVEGEPATCVPGQADPCSCADGRSGQQVCSAEGTAYSECVCTGGGGGQGGQGGGPPVGCTDSSQCPPTGDPCVLPACIGGQCGTAAAPEGVPCDDGSFCDGPDACSLGACNPIGAPACPPPPQCATSYCDEAQNACFVDPVSVCVTGDGCCPVGCTVANDQDCALYWKSGVQQNVPAASLTGWELCHVDDYGSDTPLGSVLGACSKDKLLMACRPAGSPTLTLAAMASRADVLFECGDAEDCVHQGNGVGWYFSNSWSWGFAPGGEPVYRFSCDFNQGGQTLPEQRLCWHTGNGALNIGYRCGNNDLNGDTSWERLVYQAN